MNADKARAELELFGNVVEERREGDMTVEDVIALRGCSRSHAYMMMDEAVRSGKCIAVYIRPSLGHNRPIKAIRLIE